VTAITKLRILEKPSLRSGASNLATSQTRSRFPPIPNILLKNAKAPGLEVPATALALADAVIE
jgi:hypothetical protein